MRFGGEVSPDERGDGGPAGDSEASTLVHCPYCGASVELLLDPGGNVAPDLVQAYVEDCEVCCRPWHITVRWDHRGRASVDVRTDAN
jgi:hypothetical protein